MMSSYQMILQGGLFLLRYISMMFPYLPKFKVINLVEQAIKVFISKVGSMEKMLKRSQELTKEKMLWVSLVLEKIRKFL